MTEENETKQNPRGSGYSTRQKASLIRFLESHPEEFLTAKEIHEGLVASGEKIGYTTVYRLVNALSEEGKLKKLDGVQALFFRYNGTGSIDFKEFNLGDEADG